MKGCKDFLLRWDRDNLYGWHTVTGFNGVAGFVMALEKGYDVPAVDIVKRGNFYYLCGESKSHLFQYGGHHRAISHYIFGKSLNCNLWERDDDKDFSKRKFTLIQNSVLSSNVPGGGYYYYDELLEEDAREIAKALGEKLDWDMQFLDSRMR